MTGLKGEPETHPVKDQPRQGVNCLSVDENPLSWVAAATGERSARYALLPLYMRDRGAGTWESLEAMNRRFGFQQGGVCRLVARRQSRETELGLETRGAVGTPRPRS